MSGTFLNTAEHADHYPDRLTVQEYTPGATNARGVPAPETWANVTGLVSLPCLKYDSRGDTVPSEEDGNDNMEVSTHIIQTQDYYPAINHSQRGVIDGEVYRFLMCDHEGMKTVGIIKAQRVNG